jgi:hypothetical protein
MQRSLHDRTVLIISAFITFRRLTLPRSALFMSYQDITTLILIMVQSSEHASESPVLSIHSKYTLTPLILGDKSGSRYKIREIDCS